MAVTKQLFLIFALCSSVCSMSVSSESDTLPPFASFISKYGRTYTIGTQEFEDRQKIYERSLEQVRQQNSNPDRLWSAGVNHLSDRTDAELKRLRGLRAIAKTGGKSARTAGSIGIHNNGQFLGQVKSFRTPEEKDWSHLASVKPSKDQGGCGSCWAVATSIMLEANAEINGLNRSFSPQELIDSTPNPHNCGGAGGCDGATVELAMNWVIDNGLDDSSGTPYFGIDSSCKKKSTLLLSGSGDKHLEDMVAVGFHPAQSQSPSLALQIKGWERLPENEYEPLLRAVAEHGPVAVSVGAGGWSFYGGGLFDGCGVDSTIDHAVTLIGYGTDKDRKLKFWNIKNSWGNGWGEDGKIRLLREEGNVHCGTDYQPDVGTGCDGGPKTVHVCGMCGILYDAVVPHFEKK